MQDNYGRTIDYLRISITDRCNLRCRYCMPEGIPWLPMEKILTYEEILLICKNAAALGIRKFKITGGEPLVRKGCVDFIRQLKKLPGVEQVTMTTNGVVLGDYLEGLVEAGLDAVNISLDTTDRAEYREITGFDRFPAVEAAIGAAVEAGLRVKINAVLQQGVNHSQWQSLAELAHHQPVDVRFIELMPIGNGSKGRMVSNHWLLSQLKEKYPAACVDETIHGNGPAVYYKIPGFIGGIGFISAMHGKFCDSCNRLRLTSTGEVKPCLCYGDTLSLREAARAKDEQRLQTLLVQAVAQKPKMHCFEEQNQITEGHKMAQIGG